MLRIEARLPAFLRLVIRHLLLSFRQIAVQGARSCPNCDYNGLFLPAGTPIRPEAICPNCGALERQRLFKIWLRNNLQVCSAKKILHFAPEESVRMMIKPIASEYITADITPGRADLTCNIEEIELPSNCIDLIVCFHVMEHVNHVRALAELFRILKNGGTALLMVPIVEGWDTTYENPEVIEPGQRGRHFGQHDHLRWFGRDFRSDVQQSGFALSEFVADGETSERHALIAGERLFIAVKSIATTTE